MPAPGDTVILALNIGDRDATKFPRAFVRDQAGSLLTTVDLPHIADGLYQSTWVVPAAAQFSALYIPYNDAGRTDPDDFHAVGLDIIDATSQGVQASTQQEVQIGVAFDGTTVNVNAWVEGEAPGDLQNAVLNLYSRLGALLVGPQVAASPDAQGVFAFSFTAPALPAGETLTYITVTVDNVGATPGTHSGITGVTFSKSTSG